MELPPWKSRNPFFNFLDTPQSNVSIYPVSMSKQNTTHDVIGFDRLNVHFLNWNKTSFFQAPFFFTKPRSSPARFPSPLSESLEQAKPKPLRFFESVALPKKLFHLSVGFNKNVTTPVRWQKVSHESLVQVLNKKLGRMKVWLPTGSLNYKENLN